MALIGLTLLAGCAYYNTLFNAKKYYKEAEQKQKTSKTDKITGDVRKKYQDAINKSWKLIDFYGDSSRYADDALLLIGKSHYNLKEYTKSERVLEQFLLKYLKSPLVPEAKLWLAKTYIGLQKDDQALELLKGLFEAKVSKKIAAQAFYILGDLYYQREDYEKAIENLEKCVDLNPDEEMKGDAQYLLGESFFNLEQYENAIPHYDKLTKLDIPVIKEFDAMSQKLNALTELQRFDEAEITLRKMLRNQRFKAQFSLIETKLANIFEIQGDHDFARDYYYDIMRKYPRSEGFALSAFYLGQLYEFEYSEMDSASTYYQKVKNLPSRPEVVKEAGERSGIIKEYLKIRNQLRKDRRDLYKLTRGDSSLVDSIAVEVDSSDIQNQPEEETTLSGNDQFNLGQNSDQRREALTRNKNPEAISESDTPLSQQDSLSRLSRQLKTPAKVKPKKIAVSRTPEQVEESYIKNSFARAEFFLLKYQNYDSAEVAYRDFIRIFSDSLLTPKAVYALYYIYSDLKHDSTRADSVRKEIIEKYPDSVYGQKLLGKKSAPDEQAVEKEISGTYKQQYRAAEKLMDDKQYDRAIEAFTFIAERDSGSIWARKSRLAVAYIFENYLKDTNRALQAYTVLAQEYPGTDFYKIAANKIKEPVIEIPADSLATSGAGQDSTQAKNEIDREEIEHQNPPDENTPTPRPGEQSKRPKNNAEK